jgi:hypothetical protein
MTNYYFEPPVLAGGTDKSLFLIRDEIINYADHKQFNQYSGLTRAQPLIQNTLLKFGNFLIEIHGVDFPQPMQLNESVIDCGAQL